jgi:TrmH family RNA methyltransferase
VAEFTSLERVGAGSRRLKTIRALSGDAGARSDHGKLIVEGTTSVLEAIEHGIPVDALVFADTAQGHDAWAALSMFDGPSNVADADSLGKVSSTATTPPVVAIAGIPDRKIPSSYRLLVAADALADPGNAGTLMRISEAAGADALVLGDGSVDPWSPKVVRSSAGAWARLAIVRMSILDLLAQQRSLGATVIGLDAGAGPDYRELEPPTPAIVVVGNESHGISDPVRALIDVYASIPMEPTVESLNAAVAVAVVLFAWKGD